MFLYTGIHPTKINSHTAYAFRVPCLTEKNVNPKSVWRVKPDQKKEYSNVSHLNETAS